MYFFKWTVKKNMTPIIGSSMSTCLEDWDFVKSRHACIQALSRSW